MEWVEKTGKTVEEAKERALEQLGVSEHDAEIVVLAEPKSGLFGRVRGEARLRARVRPAEPRPKRQRRQKEQRSGEAHAGGRRQPARTEAVAGDGAAESEHTQNGQDGQNGRLASTTGGTVAATGSSSRRRRRGGRGRRPSTEGGGARRADERAPASPGRTSRPGADARDGRVQQSVATREESTVVDDITLAAQGEVAKEFLEGLIERYGLQATIDVRELDAETVELSAKGDELGVLVGPKGATLAAIQDVTRTVVQHRFPNKTDRIVVDVAGYRERRVAALRRFCAQVAAEVLETATERALEPMSAADRKVVHDAIAEIDGVVSSSQGEEPYRFVVVSPAS